MADQELMIVGTLCFNMGDGNVRGGLEEVSVAIINAIYVWKIKLEEI